MASMDRQQEFVLRTLEERDIRFVRLWFTDVAGYLKAVAVAPAEIEAAFAEGIGFDGSAIEGFARGYECDMLAKPAPRTLPGTRARPGHLPGDAGDQGAAQRHRADVLRHHAARRLARLGRPAARAAPDAGQGRGHGLHLLHPPRGGVLPAQGPAGRRQPAGARRHRWLFRPVDPQRRAPL